MILKMTTAQVVDTSVTNNNLSKDYPHTDDHAKQIVVVVVVVVVVVSPVGIQLILSWIPRPKRCTHPSSSLKSSVSSCKSVCTTDLRRHKTNAEHSSLLGLICQTEFILEKI